MTTELELADADIIKFGSLNSALRLAGLHFFLPMQLICICRLIWKPVVICIPSMTSRDKSVIANLAIECGKLVGEQSYFNAK